MSGIPPANIAGSILQATVGEKQRADEKAVNDREKAQQAKEQARLTDRRQHEVEDTLESEQDRIRPHDDEESQHQRKHKHRQLPEDKNADEQDPDNPDETPHIDLQA